METNEETTSATIDDGTNATGADAGVMTGRTNATVLTTRTNAVGVIGAEAAIAAVIDSGMSAGARTFAETAGSASNGRGRGLWIGALQDGPQKQPGSRRCKSSMLTALRRNSLATTRSPRSWERLF